MVSKEDPRRTHTWERQGPKFVKIDTQVLYMHMCCTQCGCVAFYEGPKEYDEDTFYLNLLMRSALMHYSCDEAIIFQVMK